MNLIDPGTLKTFLSRHGVSAVKGLGQHFLCSKSAVDAIVDSLKDCAGVLEIGPGPGVLTSPLSEKSALIALELDSRMVSALKESAPKAEVRQIDALKADLVSVLSELPEPRGVVSNMPYYITGPLLTKIAEAKSGWSQATLMMQREVADKVIAPPGDRGRGSLSVYLQAQFDIRLVAQVPPGSFYPPPKVASTVLKMVPNGKDYSPEFYRLVRLAFAQPRKTLTNNLVAGLHLAREMAVEAIEGVGLDEKVRSQELSVEQWVRLSQILGQAAS